jgi:hypothetical protein
MGWDKFKRSKVKEMAGKRFAHWLVVERSNKDEYGNVMWRCRCDCGKEKVVSGA